MRKHIMYWFLGMSVMLTASCVRYSCPTYQTALQPKVDSPNLFFAYFQPKEGEKAGEPVFMADSFNDAPPMPAETTIDVQAPDSLKTPDGLLIFKDGEEPSMYVLQRFSVRNKNGVMVKKRSGPKNKAVTLGTPDQNSNFPKVVSTKNPKKRRHYQQLDKVEADTSAAQLIKKKDPEPSHEQFFYDLIYGSKEEETVVDSTQIADPNATGEVNPNESKKERKKREKAERKAGKLKKKRKGEPESAILSDDELSEEEMNATPEEEEIQYYYPEGEEAANEEGGKKKKAKEAKTKEPKAPKEPKPKKEKKPKEQPLDGEISQMN